MGSVRPCPCSFLTTTHTLRVESLEEENLNDTLRTFCELEYLGISSTGRSVCSPKVQGEYFI